MEGLTPLENKLLNEIIRPSISPLYKSNQYFNTTMAQELRFDILLREIKNFYERNNGKNWHKVLMDSDFF